jgi:N-acetylglucosamine-6-phosphate deacetylase
MTKATTTTALVNGRILTDDGLKDGLCVLVEGDRIVDVVSAADARLARAAHRDLGG